MDLKNQIIHHTNNLYSELLGIRRHLHRYPELSFSEFSTSEYLRGILDRWDIPFTHPIAGTGILGRIEGQRGRGPVIALRCDMDALPIKEESGLECASVNEGVMHACGHDIHMTCVLGAARVLSSLKENFGGNVILVFQPGEEKLPGGAKLMMEEGVFDEYKPDLIIGQHVLPEMKTGMVGFKPGMYMASSDEIYITVRGKGGHGAMPEHINDPVLMTSHILISLQQEINRRSPKGIPTVLSFGRVEANGAVNVIPDQVSIEGTFRTMNESWRKEAHRLIRQVSEGIAKSMDGTVDLEIRHGYPVLVNDPQKTGQAREMACEMIGSENVVELDFRMTAEDFAWYSHQYPAVFFRLGIMESGQSEPFRLHTGSFKADEEAIRTGVQMLSWLAMGFMDQDM